MNIFNILQQVADAYSSAKPIRPPKDEMEIHDEVERNLNVSTLREIFNKEHFQKINNIGSSSQQSDGEINNIIQQHIQENELFEQQRVMNEMINQQILNQQAVDFTYQTLQQTMDDSIQMQNQMNQDIVANQSMMPPNMF